MAAANNNNPFDLTISAICVAELRILMREYQQAEGLAAQAIELSKKHKLSNEVAYSRCALGRAMAELGRASEGVTLVRQGLAHLIEVGLRLPIPTYLASLAVALLMPCFQRSELVGVVAGFGRTFAAVPDLIAMLTRRSSIGIHPTMACIMGVFQIVWVYYGLLIASRPVIAWNMIASVINFLTVGAYLRFARAKGINSRNERAASPRNPLVYRATCARTAKPKRSPTRRIRSPAGVTERNTNDLLDRQDGIWRACSEATAHHIESGEAGTAGTPAPCGGLSLRHAVHSEAAHSAERLDAGDGLDRCSLRISEVASTRDLFLKDLGHEESRT